MSKLKSSLDKAFEKNNEDLGKKMKALSSNTEPEEVEEAPGKGRRVVAVSFTQEEHDFIKEVFEAKGRGMKFSTGLKIAALYVAERLDSGHISMSRAGINERR